jgi:hypothetical protein
MAKTIRQIFRVERREINYLRVTIESYDGMALVRTVDPEEATIEILVSPGCEAILLSLIESLKTEEGILLEKPGESMAVSSLEG